MLHQIVKLNGDANTVDDVRNPWNKVDPSQERTLLDFLLIFTSQVCGLYQSTDSMGGHITIQ